MKEATKSVKERKEVKRNIKVIRAQIELFDFHDFIRLLQKGRSQKNKIKDQAAIVMIGLSKCGKTTMTTAALGYKLRKTTIKGMPTLQSIRKLEGEYTRLVNSPEMKSITRNPAFFEIDKTFL